MVVILPAGPVSELVPVSRFKFTNVSSYSSSSLWWFYDPFDSLDRLCEFKLKPSVSFSWQSHVAMWSCPLAVASML